MGMYVYTRGAGGFDPIGCSPAVTASGLFALVALGCMYDLEFPDAIRRLPSP